MLYVNPVSPELTRTMPSDAVANPKREAAVLQELEHFFLYQLLTEMRKTVDDGGLFTREGGLAVFEDLMDDAIAQKMAESGQLGIANAIEAQLHQHDVQSRLNTV